MKLHGNARTCPKSRRLPGQLDAGRVEAIEALGLALGTPARHPLRRGPLAAVSDQPSSSTRRVRMTAAEIAECLGLALSTVSRWLKRIGLGKLSRLEPPEPPNRYERKRPGELVHVDVKKLGRIPPAARLTDLEQRPG